MDDNYPVITPLTKNVTIVENSPVGTIVAVFQATDADGSNVKFSVIPDDKTFGIVQTASTCQIILIKTLDYVTRDRYNITINVIDESGHAANETALLIINVQNVDDNTIEFEKFSFTFNVVENISVNTIIGEVKALEKNSSSKLNLQNSTGSRSNIYSQG